MSFRGSCQSLKTLMSTPQSRLWSCPHRRSLFFSLQWSADPAILRKSLNTCTSLFHLKLSHKILVDFPTYSCLPSLVKLELYGVMYKDDASLVRLSSSCPVLESLSVVRIEDDNVAKFSVKVPSLRFLSYSNDKSMTYENDVVNAGRYSLVMDTPALTQFYISDCSGDSWSIKNMPCLQDARIRGQSFHDTAKLLRSASAVSSLGLHLTDELAVYCSTIEFPQLIECNISPCNSDWMDSLLLFLGNTPKLKSFRVDYGFTYEPPPASASWYRRFPVPECLYSSLEKFELIDYGGRDEEKEFLEYILILSQCLKTATISMRSNLEDRETIMETLNSILVWFNNISFSVQT